MYKRLGIGAYYNPDEPSITNLYKDQGYLTSQIDPAEIIIGKDSIDLEVRVFEGKHSPSTMSAFRAICGSTTR